MKNKTIGNAQRNVLQKMFTGSELFYWGAEPKQVHLRKTKSGEFGTTGEIIRKKLFAELREQGFISEFEVKAGRSSLR